jgi:hypothetical protein
VTQVLTTAPHVAAEWTLTGRRQHEDPWGALCVSACLTAADGSTRRIPAYWAGGESWAVRVVAAAPGTYRLTSECSDSGDAGLHGQEATLEVRPAGEETSPLLRHGPVQVAADGPRFVHQDGTPFFWLGDTWWMVMSDRVRWPDGFQALVADRAARGFTVVQTVLGYPGDLATEDPRAGNEGGLPWDLERGRLNPRYFDACDVRLNWLIRHGIVPCILGSWGYHLLALGEERMASHWRYLVARYAAWPVIWCLAGEGAMSYYLSADPAGDSARLRGAWSRLARLVRELDPWQRPLSLHPRSSSWADLEDPEPLTFHMLQPGHMANALERGVALIAEARSRYPRLPVVNAEPPYEGHMGTNGPEVQRYAFWSSLLSGAAGFTTSRDGTGTGTGPACSASKPGSATRQPTSIRRASRASTWGKSGQPRMAPGKPPRRPI